MKNKIILFLINTFICSYICDIPKEALVCQKPKCLTIRKDTEKINDLYYIKYGFTYSISKYLYHQRVNYSQYFSNQTIVPKAYFEISQKLQLNIDKESYIQLAIIWMMTSPNSKSIFYRKNSQKYLPDNLPIEWGNIDNEIIEYYKNMWKTLALEKNSSSIYADFFMINKVGCLITGYGKTKACRKIADKELVLDSVTITKNRSQVFGSYGLFGGIETPIEIAYCIHMLSPEETTSHQVVETDLLHYMYYAEGNINYFGTLGAFYKSFEDSATKYLLVPYCNTLDEKALALQNYFDNH